MKKLFILFLILMLSFILFVACDDFGENGQIEMAKNISDSSLANSGSCNDNQQTINAARFPDYSSDIGKGVFYSLRFSYEQNYISLDDLLNIAYYNNGGDSGNETLMSDDFAPKVITPEALGEVTDWRIKTDYINQYLTDSEGAKVENVTIKKYLGCYGDYNNCVALQIGDDYHGISGTVKTVVIDGVTFVFPSYEIVIWKMDVEYDFQTIVF